LPDVLFFFFAIASSKLTLSNLALPFPVLRILPLTTVRGH
jgi:hypothetical protein